jgi:hypothetical protein
MEIKGCNKLLKSHKIWQQLLRSVVQLKNKTIEMQWKELWGNIKYFH